MLETIWFLIICFEIALYVILDGADLGIGLLSLFTRAERDKSLLIHAVGPIWDANETWLVVGAGTLFGAFPSAYGIILSALYIPVMILLFGLIIRAAAFEFREYADWPYFWSVMFGIGSLMAIVGQGCLAGGLLGGIAIQGREFAGDAFDWLSPLTFFMTVGIALSYVVVGYAYLLKKDDRAARPESFRSIIAASAITFVSFVGATILLPAQHYVFFERWSEEPTRSILFALSALIGIAGGFLIYGALTQRYVKHLHTLCMIVFSLALVGLVIGVYPYMIPPVLTIFDAASSHFTLTFMLYGIAPLLPIVLSYNLYMYHVFKGKAEDAY